MEENSSQPRTASETVNQPAATVKKPAEAGVPITRPLVAVQPLNEKACPVCGHVNKAQSFLCEMCSNYLID